MTWLRWAAPFLRPRQSSSSRHYRPSLELLEERCALSGADMAGSGNANPTPAVVGAVSAPVVVVTPAPAPAVIPPRSFGSLKEREDHVVQFTLSYGRGLLAFVFQPPDFNPAMMRVPAIAFFHGGGLDAGSPATWFRAARYFAARGIVAISFDYRLGGPAKAAQSVADARSALRWMRQQSAQLGINPDRIVAAGDSAGGYLALLTALADNQPDDLYRDTPVRPNAIVAFYPVLDGSLAGLPAGMSPLTLAQKQTLPPTLIVQGTNDQQAGTSLTLAAKFSSGLPNALVAPVFGGVHGFMGGGRLYRFGLTLMDVYLNFLGFTPGAAKKIPGWVQAAG
jgi:acetyl esterase